MIRVHSLESSVRAQLDPTGCEVLVIRNIRCESVSPTDRRGLTPHKVGEMHHFALSMRGAVKGRTDVRKKCDGDKHPGIQALVGECSAALLDRTLILSRLSVSWQGGTRCEPSTDILRSTVGIVIVNGLYVDLLRGMRTGGETETS
jgi:hypothetical protein